MTNRLTADGSPKTFERVIRFKFLQSFGSPFQSRSNSEAFGFVHMGFSFQKFLQVPDMASPESTLGVSTCFEASEVPFAGEEMIAPEELANFG